MNKVIIISLRQRFNLHIKKPVNGAYKYMCNRIDFV